MPKMLLLFSHKLNEEQLRDAKDSLNIKEFISLPSELQGYWSNVNPRSDDIENFEKIMNFVKGAIKEGDFVLIQGEWGFTYRAVLRCKKYAFIPIYSATERDVKEKVMDDGKIEKTSIFKHVTYKKY